MKLIQTKNTEYNSMLTFKTYLFDEKEEYKHKIEICFDIPFYNDESIDFHCDCQELTPPREMRLMFMGASEDQIEEIKNSHYIIVTCVHD